MNLTQYNSKTLSDVPTRSIWASEIGYLLRDRCYIDGYDISSAQFPHKSCLPQNVRLIGDTDLLGELDPKMLAKYDVVHSRFWVLIIQQDISPLINNLFRMVKPGGWVQFTDAYMAEHWIIYPDGIDPKSTKQGTQGVLDGFRDFRNLVGIGGESFTWQKDVEKLFRAAGFVNYEFTVHRAPEPHASYNSDQLLVLGEELARNLLMMGEESGVDEERARKLLLASVDAKEESTRGIHMNWTLFTVRAQRPISS